MSSLSGTGSATGVTSAGNGSLPVDPDELRGEVAAVLGLSAEELDPGEDLVEHGMDSVSVIGLLNGWQARGAALDYADLVADPRVTAWWTLLCDARSTGSGEPPASPEPVDPGEPFPLTPVQHAYWIGRKGGQSLGGVACHAYMEFDAPSGAAAVRAADLERAMRAATVRHPMLRARILDDGRQQVLAESPWRGVTVHDHTGDDPDAERAHTTALREEFGHRMLDIGAGEVFDLRLTLLPGGRHRLHLDVDLVVADVVSIQRLLVDLAELHAAAERDPDTDLAAAQRPPEYTFAHYVAEHLRRSERERERAWAFWRDRFPALRTAAPRLPVRLGRPDRVAPRFSRRSFRLPEQAWRRLEQRCRRHRLTPSVVLATAFADVLGRWGGQSEVALNVPLFDRRGEVDPTMVADFTTLVLVVVETGTHLSFAERAGRAGRRFTEAIAHSGVSAVEVLREMNRDRPDPVAAPVVFASSLDGPFVDAAFAARFGELSWMISQTPQVWLDHQLYVTPDGLLLTWDGVDAIFPDGVLDDMFAAYTRLVDALAGETDTWASAVGPELPHRQRDARAAANATAAPVPDALLHDGLRLRAAAAPTDVALVDAHTVLDYGRTWQRASAVAARIAEYGVTAGEPVAVAMPRGVDQVVATIGAVLGGVPYLPLELGQPVARQAGILADAGVRLVLTDRPRSWPDPAAGVHVLVQDDACTGTAPPVRRDPDDPAYVVYTSGSTGRPKGVVISHRGAVNTIADVNERFRIGAGDRVLGLANLGFDLSVWDVFGVLAAGGTLVVPDPERRADPSHWAELVAAHRITVWNSVPAQLQMLDHYLDYDQDTDVSSLRLAMLSGDWIPLGLPDSVRAKVPGLSVVSLGGATEASIWSICFPIGEVDPRWRSIPYGFPLTNQSFHVLDDRMRDCPDHVSGELYIGGTGLALEYLGDPDKTAERFVRHPVTGERLYRTGDLGRYRPDGVIEFLGRVDTQVKIRGHRIELGEIEAALEALPGVAAGAVVVQGEHAMERRLAGFAVAGPAPEPVRGPVPHAPRVSAAADPVADPAAVAAGRRFRAALASAAHASMLQALVEHGALRPGPGGVLPEPLRRSERIVRRWTRELRAAGLLREGTDGLEPAGPARDTDPLGLWQHALAVQVDAVWPRRVTEFFASCASRLGPLLRGEQEMTALLFGRDDVATAESAFAGNAVVRHLNAAVAEFVAVLADDRAPRPLRIMEIGAGVAATTAPVLDALGDRAVEYIVTDVSSYFLNHAQARLGPRPGVRYGRFDIDVDHRGQGLEPNSLDVIIAANVLHNAAHLPGVVAGCAELLAPGGWLLCTEITGDVPELMTSMEFLLGGVEFVDDRAGTSDVFPDVARWTALLRAAGGTEITALPTDPVLAEGRHHLLAARFKGDRAPLDADGILADLADLLPEHMVPSRLQVVDRLPLTDNGKVDRRALTAALSGAADPAPERVEPPRTDTEVRLAAIWSDVLRLPSVGRDQDFHAVGGDSLLVTQVINRVRAEPEWAGAEFDALLRACMVTPTVAGFARHLDGLRHRQPFASTP